LDRDRRERRPRRLRKIDFVNGHGGQPQVMQIVARELRARYQMFAVAANWWDCGYPDGVISPEEAAHGIHGGQSETSIMLHLMPDLVRMVALQDWPDVRAMVGHRRIENAVTSPGCFAWSWRRS
jgi:creatinine amidohydrolase/Fe(II)-dependent formamide hydrolase-like protein